MISGKKFFAVRPPHFLGWIDALGYTATARKILYFIAIDSAK
jgi:hypothetical protein